MVGSLDCKNIDQEIKDTKNEELNMVGQIDRLEKMVVELAQKLGWYENELEKRVFKIEDRINQLNEKFIFYQMNVLKESEEQHNQLTNFDTFNPEIIKQRNTQQNIQNSQQIGQNSYQKNSHQKVQQYQQMEFSPQNVSQSRGSYVFQDNLGQF